MEYKKRIADQILADKLEASGAVLIEGPKFCGTGDKGQVPVTVQGVHARGYNSCSLGVVYEGGVDENGKNKDTRTAEQKHTLYALLKELTRSYPDARIIGHRELPHVAKDCPCFLASKEYADLQPECR